MLFCLEDAAGDWETQKKIPVKLLHCLQAYCVLDVVLDTLERAKKMPGAPNLTRPVAQPGREVAQEAGTGFRLY